MSRASHLLLKPVDLGDLADHGHDIAVLKGIVSGELNIGLAGMLHRDDIDAVDLAQVKLPHTLTQHFAAHSDAAHLDTVPQCDIVQQVA